MKLFLGIISIAVMLALPLYSIAEPLAKFDTKNHPKSNGLWLAVKYPSSWRAAEGERPHIIQKFDRVDGDFYQSLMLQVNPLPAGAMQEVQSLTTKDMTEFCQSFADNSRAYGVKKFIHEGQAAFIGNVDYSMDRVNQTFTFSQRLMVVFYKSNMIMLYCGTGSKPSYKAEMLIRQQSLSGSVCLQYFNSLVLMDRY